MTERMDGGIKHLGASSECFAAMASWSPKPSNGVPSKVNELGFPTVIHRTPSRLVEECEQAFDAGLLLAALTLAVTIPDVCAHIDGTDYRTWCSKYMGLLNSGEKRKKERSQSKTQEDIEKGFSVIESSGVFTASDLYQLRCAVVHAGSSSIEDKGTGAKYSPYRVIGVCVHGDARGVIASYGHTGTGAEDQQSDCAYHCAVKLEGLILLLAKGVRAFLEEDPSRDREYSDESTEARLRCGVTDYRPLLCFQDSAEPMAGLGAV